MYPNFCHNYACFLGLCVWLTLPNQTSQFPPGIQNKRFNIEAVPANNGKIMLHLRSRYGSSGIDGPMGDAGPPGVRGSPGPMGDEGEAGVCPVELCSAMLEARMLVSRVEALENLVRQQSLHSDAAKPSDSPLMALHITSDILLTKGNVSTGKATVPGNIKVNIALKNAGPLMENAQHGGKFLVNSTVQLLDHRKINEQKHGMARQKELDGVAMTERQFQYPRSNLQEEVPSIKKSRIPHAKNP